MSKPFPTFQLSRKSSPTEWKKQPMFDPGIVDEMASGDANSRALFTAILYNISFSYHWLTSADVDLILDHQEHVMVTAAAFDLRDVYSNEDWRVRHKSAVMIRAEPQDPNVFVATLNIFGKQVNKMRTARIAIGDLGAGVDVSALPIFADPQAVTVNSIGILSRGAPAGVDDSNTAVLEVKNDATVLLVSKTYDTSNQPPSSDYADLGTVSNGSLNAGQHLTFSITQGATANMPAFDLIIEYYYTP